MRLSFLKSQVYFLFISSIIILQANTSESDNIIVVAKDGSGDYTTITQAINSLPMFVYERTIIFVREGIYNEKIKIDQNHITLLGEDRERTIIEFDILREKWNNEKDHIGPGVINVNGDEIILENLTIKNTQQTVGPHAFAVYGMGTKTIITNCNVLSKGADTIALWDYKSGFYYINNCYVEGAVDFVCPRGWCYIKDSQFYELKATATIWHAGGFDKDQKLVIVNSSFDGVESFKLARHHYEAQFYFINCSFSSNMANDPIYRVTYEDTTRNRPFNWGERYYFFNASGVGSKYDWLKDNLEDADCSPSAEMITPEWTFSNKWNPEEFIPTILPDSLK